MSLFLVQLNLGRFFVAPQLVGQSGQLLGLQLAAAMDLEEAVPAHGRDVCESVL